MTDSIDISPRALVYGCLIIYEIAERYVDFVIGDKYTHLFNNPNLDDYKTLRVTWGIGMYIAAIRIIVCTCCRKDCSEDDRCDEKRLHAVMLWTCVAKVLFEEFPQSTMTKFCFSNCVTTESMKTLVQAYDVFSIIAFVVFVCYLAYYYCKYNEEPTKTTVIIIMVITFILSLVGFIFACLSINEFNEFCPPPQ